RQLMYPAAAEVGLQVDADAAAVPSASEGAVLLLEDPGIGQAEAVDALLDVAHQNAVALALLGPAHQRDQPVLHGVDVLVLVDQDLDEPAAALRQRPAAGVGQRLQGQALEIGEIEAAGGGFERAVAAGELPD